MKSKSITFTSVLLFMVVAFLIMPGVGGAAMWIGLEGGANIVANGDVKGEVYYFSPLPGLRPNFRIKDVKTEASALGGVTIGYDFVKGGFLGYDWPKWMKYFSVAIDVTYNDFSQRSQSVRATAPSGPPAGPIMQFPLQISEANGYMVGLSMLFIAKYGFFSDPEFPFGRLIPYAGVGPAGFFSVVKTPIAFCYSSSSDSNEFGIVTEGGVRYMVWPQVSIDAAFRYRYVVPSYDVQYSSNFGNFREIGRITAQQFSAIFRVNYHF